jgi:hypothetical protein
MYIGHQTRKITNLLKKTRAFTCIQNHKHNLESFKTKTKKNIYDSSGIYELACQECSKRYEGKMGHAFKARYKEHIQAIKTNKKCITYS